MHSRRLTRTIWICAILFALLALVRAAGAATYSYTSDQIDSELGASVCTAGDVDGDGYFDLLVGEPGYDNGQTDEGRVLLYRGSADGLELVESWSFESNQIGARCGAAVSTAGDVNGDGYDDVLVGAPEYFLSSGRVYVFYGSASGLSSTPDRTYNGLQGASFTGTSVASAGDLNADGFDDIAFGAPEYTPSGLSDAGRVFVYYGSAGGLSSGAPALEGQEINGEFGISVSGAGDVNGDGYDDLVVGAHVEDGDEVDAGRVHIFHGGPSGISSSAASVLSGESSGDGFGRSVSTAGDVDGDGYADILVGAPGYDVFLYSGIGKVYAYHGGAGGVDGISEIEFTGGITKKGLGAAVACAGDMNGDGYSDVILGAPGSNIGSSPLPQIQLQYGSSGGLGAGNVISGTSLSRFGASVATAGDVNGDGLSDWVAGAPSYADKGQARARDSEGATPIDQPSWTAAGDIDDNYGATLADAGDVNGDGYSELVIGASWANTAYLYQGTADGMTPFPVWTESGDSGFGQSLSSAGDVNGDGYGDLIVSAPTADNGFGHDGRVYVHHGSAAGLSTAPDWTVEENEAGGYFGQCVAGAGDVNGDGFADVIVGAWSNGAAYDGAAYVYLGSSAGLSTTPAWTVRGDQAGAQFGMIVTGAGDMNGDGFSDVLVSSPRYQGAVPDAGAIWVYHGSAAGLATTPSWSKIGDSSGAWFGLSAIDAGDVNNDGFSDILVGAPYYSDAIPFQGRAFCYLGSATDPSLAPWSYSGGQNWSFGAALGAGDINGDGFTDIVVSAPGFSDEETAEGMVLAFRGTKTGLYHAAMWLVEGDQANLGFCDAIATVDIDADGFSDVALGKAFANDPFGAARVYLGSGGYGRDRHLLQRRLDGSTPIALAGRTVDTDAFELSVEASSPAGRSRVRFEVEVKPAGVTFDGSDLLSTPMTDTGIDGTTLSMLVTGLAPETPYHWRARLVDASPLFPPGRWMSLHGNGAGDVDLRTGPIITATGPVAGLSSVFLAAPSPNPATGRSQVQFALARASRVRLGVYDRAGRRVALLADELRGPGTHRVDWYGRDSRGQSVAAGAYFLRLDVEGEVQTRKLLRMN